MSTESTPPRRGRVTPPLRAVLFETTGVTLYTRRMGPTTRRELAALVRQQWRASDDPFEREPQPPLPPLPAPQPGVIVDAGMREPNRADPDYIAAHAAWEDRLSAAVGAAWLRYAAQALVEVTIDHDHLERVRRARRLAGLELSDHPDYTQDEHDRYDYLFYCVWSEADGAEMGMLRRALFEATYPTESEVADALASFRAELAGAPATRRDPATPVEPHDDPAGGGDSPGV